MAACGLGGSLSIKMFVPSINVNSCKLSSLEAFGGQKKMYALSKSSQFSWLVRLQKTVKLQSVTCCTSTQKGTSSVVEKPKEEKAVDLRNNSVPTASEVENLLTDICDSSIAEFELKVGGFQLHVKRQIENQVEHVVAPDPPPSVDRQTTQELDTNGSVASTSLALSRPNLSAVTVQDLLSSATDEGLAILQSPKVGFFRRRKTIKGKRAPPSCKENQIVKEGQVLCFIEQLGGEIPIESDVSGEVIKILRRDGEPVGYGDALIAVLPSFPGIKKLQ